MTLKTFTGGTERATSPADTIRAARAIAPRVGITRVADITGLDTIGLPVFAVVRPNSRSVSVSQGKGLTAAEAEASGLMEAIESYHAEHVQTPLLLQSHSELRRSFPSISLDGLTRVAGNCFHEHRQLLWAQGEDLVAGNTVMLPYECVHTDFRLPLPSGSGCFLMSSNGLASGNAMVEATLHGLYELIERDAITLFTYSGTRRQARRRVALNTVNDSRCQKLLTTFEGADMKVAIWDTTSDLQIPSFVCTLADGDAHKARPMPAVHGAGCHNRRGIALLRALTEAAQSRLTIISGSRDDLGATRGYAAESVAAERSKTLALFADTSCDRSFDDGPDIANASFELDLVHLLRRLAARSLHQVVRVDLSRSDLGVPVVKMVVPHLEGMSAIPGYTPGTRGRAVLAELS